MRIQDLTLGELNDSRKDTEDALLFHNKDFIDECDKYIAETIITDFKHGKTRITLQFLQIFNGTERGETEHYYDVFKPYQINVIMRELKNRFKACPDICTTLDVDECYDDGIYKLLVFIKRS